MDKEVPLPEYKTAGAAAMDYYLREDLTIAPKEIAFVKLNIATKAPRGHFILCVARSSMWKRGLMMANNAGIIDEDYSGDGDEHLCPIYNFSNEPVTVKRGERILQFMVLPFDRVEWEEVETLGPGPDRGGFGTTGK